MQGEIPTEKSLSYIGKLLLPVKASPHFKFFMDRAIAFDFR